MQAQHPLLPAAQRWMPAIQAKGFQPRTLSVGNTATSSQKSGLMTCSVTQPMARARKESASLGEFYPFVTVCLCLVALAGLLGQSLVMQIKWGSGQNLFPFWLTEQICAVQVSQRNQICDSVTRTALEYVCTGKSPEIGMECLTLDTSDVRTR